MRSIYTKLDVHSRRELLEFLATVDVGVIRRYDPNRLSRGVPTGT